MKSTQHQIPAIPSTGFVRSAAMLPHLGFSSATLWRKVKDGTFPQPVKLSERITAWRAEEVHAWIGAQGKAA